jgi:hypothetical protein
MQAMRMAKLVADDVVQVLQQLFDRIDTIKTRE